MKGKTETDPEKKIPPRRFFSPETSLFEPIFTTEYELRDVKGKYNTLNKSFAHPEKKGGGLSKGLPRLIGASRNSPMEQRYNQEQTAMAPSPKFSNLADYVRGPHEKSKTRWKRKEIKTEQLITNSSLLRELKSVIGAREKKRAQLDFQNKPKIRHKHGFSDTLAWTSKREKIEEEAFIDFKKTSTKAVSTKRSEVASPRNNRTPGTPAYELFLSNESVLPREAGSSRAQYRQAMTPQTAGQKKLPLHMNHPLIGIKPILLGAQTAEEVKRAAGSLRSSQGEEELMRILHGEGLKQREAYRRSSSVEPGKPRPHRNSRRNFNVSYLLANERPLHQTLLESITNLTFLKSEFETQFQDLSLLAQKNGKLEELELQGKQADLYGLHLVLSEMGQKLGNISQEEKIGFVQDNLQETLKDLSKIYRVINKEIYRNVHPALASPSCQTFDKFEFCEELRSELFTILLKYVKQQVVGGGAETKSSGGNPFQDLNLQEDRVRQIVGLALESVQEKFQSFCKETSHKTLQAMLILEQCWKLALMPYETIYSNRDFLLEQEVQVFKQKMAVKEEELKSQKADLEFSVKELKESQKKDLESLKVVIERLKRDNERLIVVVQDREDQMRMMKDQRARPHQALNNYLTEMEDLLHGTLQERRKQMETMGMMADVCTVDIPEANTQMKRMKRRKMKSRRSYLDQNKAARFSSPARSDRDHSSSRNPADKSIPSSSRDVRKSILLPGGGGGSSPTRTGQFSFLEAVEETPRDAQELAKEWENCATIEELAQLFSKCLFKEEEILQIKDMIRDMYMVAGQEARSDLKRLHTSQKNQDSSKLVVSKTEPVKREEAKMKKRPSLTLKGIFNSAASNPNFRLLAGHCNTLEKMSKRMEDLVQLSQRLEQYLQIQRRAVEEGYNSEDTEAAILFQKVPLEAPRDQGVQTYLRFHGKAQIDYTKIVDSKNTANAPSTKLRKGVNPLLMVLNFVRGNPRPLSPQPFTPPSIEQALTMIDEAIDEKFKDELAQMKRAGGSVLCAKIAGGSLSQDFASFFYDFIMLKTGRKTKALEVLRHIENLLKMYKLKGVNLCEQFLALLGLDDDLHLTSDEEEIALRSRMFFKNVLRLWRATMASEEQKNEKYEAGDQRVNFTDLMDQLQNRGFKTDQANAAGVLKLIQPCQPVSSSGKGKPQFQHLHLSSGFSKIVNRLSKLNKSPSYLMDVADLEKKGIGVNVDSFWEQVEDKCAIYLTKEEQKELTEILDQEKTGVVTLEAVLKLMEEESPPGNPSGVSCGSFMKAAVEQWRVHKKTENERFMKVFEDFDDNKDGVLSLHEFEKMLKSLEPQLRRGEVVRLYRETLDAEVIQTQLNDFDKMSPAAFCDMSLYYQLGGVGRAFFHEYFVGAGSVGKKKK